VTNQTIEGNLESLLDYLKRTRGIDFTGYKRTSLSRRIQKRMYSVEINNYANYVDFLEVYPEEFTHLLNTILINVTSFFRDPATWDFISATVIPHLVALKPSNRPLRIWTAGCSSGEETYSITMLLAEAIGKEAFASRVKIYATDIDEEALTTARSAIYTEKDVKAVPPQLCEKYFTRTGNNYSFNKDLRRSVIFGRHDIIQDAPISKIDLLISRNLIMYFNADTQTQVLSRMRFALNEDGYLVLGRSEMLLTRGNIFTPVDLKHRVFQRAARTNIRDRLPVMSRNDGDEGANNLAVQGRLRDTAFEESPIPQIMVDADGNLVLANELARSQFGLSPQDIGNPFQDTQLSYRPTDLRTAIENATETQSLVRLKKVEWKAGIKDLRYLEVLITPVMVNRNGLSAVNITFLDVTAQILLQDKVEQTNMELETAMEELQSTNEELETTNEELQSTIEELETTNEELQSTNEELETMNEELQSTNEELETINDELGVRTDSLNQVNAFLENILSSFKGGVIVLGCDMKVQAWNHHSENLWGLRMAEVAGQNFFGLDIGLPVAALRPQVLSILSGEKSEEITFLEATNRRGKRIQCKLTITPMISPDQKINGTVLMLEDTAAAAKP